MNVLILGGTGLISTAITRELVARGAQVTLYNRGKTPPRVPAGTTTLTGDRYDFPAFERQMTEVGPFDCVIDMICFTPDQAESAVRAFRGRVGQFLFCSTVDVYSKPAHRYPVLENESRRGNNDYGRNKVLCEDVFFAAHARGDFPATIIRPAFTYGEGGGILDWTGWSTRIIDRIRKGKPIIVHGDGSSLWSCCHVEDAARAFATAAGNPRTYGKAYHVTGEEWLTWNQYYEGIAEALQVPTPPFIHIPTDTLGRIAPERAMWCVTNFQGNNIFDNAAARTDLNFQYTIRWVEGARRTIAWLDASQRIDNSDDDPTDDRIIAAWQKLEQALGQVS